MGAGAREGSVGSGDTIWLLPPGTWLRAQAGLDGAGSNHRRQLTFVGGHDFLSPHSFPRAEVSLGLIMPSRHVPQHTDKVCLQMFPHTYMPGRRRCINLLQGTAARLSMFSHKVSGAFLPVGLPGSGSLSHRALSVAQTSMAQCVFPPTCLTGRSPGWVGP